MYLNMYLTWPTGDVEILTNIRPDDRLVLESYLFPIGLEFVELVYSVGESTATVRTKKTLDADELKEVCSRLSDSLSWILQFFHSLYVLFLLAWREIILFSHLLKHKGMFV